MIACSFTHAANMAAVLICDLLRNRYELKPGAADDLHSAQLVMQTYADLLKSLYLDAQAKAPATYSDLPQRGDA
jgi:hypothetical protein